VKECEYLTLVGVMTIGALARSQDTSSPNEDFEALVKVRYDLSKQLDLPLELSMGMSGDFEEAIRLGADNVRIGSTIFGARPPKNSQSAENETAQAKS